MQRNYIEEMLRENNNELNRILTDNINQMLADGINVFSNRRDDFRIIRAPNDKFYIFSLTPLGAGADGTIYEAYEIEVELEKNRGDKKVAAKLAHIKENKSHIPEKLAIKEYHRPQEYNLLEHEIFDSHYGSQGAFKIRDSREDHEYLYAVMQHLPGTELTAFNHPEIQNYTLLERLELIQQIAMAFNNLHHNTPATGKSVIHGDVKGLNILLKTRVVKDKQSNEEKSRFDVRIIDFGLSLRHEDFSQGASAITGLRGVPYYMAPEILQGEISIKSDIYSLTAVFAEILGANPTINKQQTLTSQIVKTPFDLEDMCKFNIPPEIAFLIPQLELFLNRMQKQNVAERASSDEVLRFFTTAVQFCVTIDDIKNLELDEDQKSAALSSIMEDWAKLILLSNGLWNLEIGKREIPVLKSNKTSKETDDKQEDKPSFYLEAKSFEHYDFNSNPNFCEALAVADKNHLKIDKSFILSLLKSDIACHAMIIIDKNHLKIDKNLILVLVNSELACKAMIVINHNKNNTACLSNFCSKTLESMKDTFTPEQEKFRKIILNYINIFVTSSPRKLTPIINLIILLQNVKQDMEKHHQKGKFYEIIDKQLISLQHEIDNLYRLHLNQPADSTQLVMSTLGSPKANQPTDVESPTQTDAQKTSATHETSLIKDSNSDSSHQSSPTGLHK